MKKIYYLLLMLMLFTSTVIAQQVPQGMKYQAVARNLRGEILANEQVVLKITLSSKRGGSSVAYYTEMHNVKTNELGLFTLVVGEGSTTKPNFNDIPWSSENIWMDIDIADKSKGGFTTISSSKLLAVPYAFHAATANKLTSMPEEIVTGSSTGSSTPPSNPWTLKGNSGLSIGDYLGTSDNKSISIRTNGLERMLLTNTGDLSVLNNVNLNTLSGNTINNGNFTVANSKATRLTGTLDVTDNVAVNTDKFNINASTGNTSLAGTLGIVGNLSVNTNKFNIAALTGNTGIAGTLNVANLVSFTDGTQSTSTANGALAVAGGAGIGKNLNIGGGLNVTGLATLKNLAVDGVTGKSINISDNSQGYLATFTNTNNDNGANAGDGIKIQLGKERPLDLGSFQVPQIGAFLPNTTDKIKSSFFVDGAFNTSLSATTFFTNLGDGIWSDIQGYSTMFTSAACNLTNVVIGGINDQFANKVILPQTTLYGGGNPVLGLFNLLNGDGFDQTSNCSGGSGITDLLIPDGWVCSTSEEYIGNAVAIPPIIIPQLKIPAIPSIQTCAPFTNPFNWSLSLPTLSTNPLTKNNEFIGFFDKNGTKVGAIRGQSMEDIIEDLTDIPTMVSVAANFIIAFDLDAGTPDPFAVVRMGAKAVDYIVSTWDKLGSIGVEYSSGNGDYAEWLQRVDSNELIGTGDIVAVKGGKITKNLRNAEQIMAVSYKPIVLGNVPDKDKMNTGNIIAFMGQIPVKVLGPVKAGDYIVAKSDVLGYGVAVNPINMQVEDYKLAVGRSWATDESKGPKMVNTVVGVHNNNFLDIIKDLKEKTEINDARLKAIEDKLNISSDVKGIKEKKAFK